MNDEARQQLLGAGMKLPLAGFVLDLGAEALRDADGKVVNLRPRAWAVLRHLALAAGRLVTKEELLQGVWPGLVVTDASLTQAVCDVREALGEAGHRLLKTVPRRGYMLVADSVASAWQADRGQPLPPEAGRPSIAVLAFASPADDPHGDVLARGVARDLVGELARNADLRVISPMSSFSLAPGSAPPSELGRRLHARFVVDGAVRRVGDTLRIDVQLIDTSDERVVRAEQHVVAAAELPSMRDALMQRMAASLNATSRHAERRSAARAPRTLDVYALTLRGVMLITRFDVQATIEGRKLFEQAIQLDPAYAPAWAGLGFLNTLDITNGFTGEWDERRVPECRSQLAKAIVLDPDHPSPYRSLVYLSAASRDFDGALAAAERAAQLAPSSIESIMALGKAHLLRGELGAAWHHAQAAFDLDVLGTGWVAGSCALTLWACGRLDEALKAADDALVRLPRYMHARLTRIYALAEKGDIVAARREASALLVLRPDLTGTHLIDRFDDRAVDIRARVRKICFATGIPSGAWR